MQMEFQQSESIAERRRWILVLVDSADGVTGLTGQTGTVKVSKNGAAPASSTNSIVEVDSVNMPGHYYIELTAAELSTLGMISIYYKAAGSLAFHDRGFVTYNNPYQSAGGFSGGVSTTKSGGLTKAQADDLLKQIREVVKEEVQAIDKDFPTMTDYTAKLDNILELISKEEVKEVIDFSPVLEAIGQIEKPNNYSRELVEIVSKLTTLGKSHTIDVKGFETILKEFRAKMDVSTEEINGSIKEVAGIKNGFVELQKLMDEFKATLAEQKDMDKRFDAMNSAANNTKLETLAKKITDLAVAVTNLRFDIKEAALK